MRICQSNARRSTYSVPNVSAPIKCQVLVHLLAFNLAKVQKLTSEQHHGMEEKAELRKDR